MRGDFYKFVKYNPSSVPMHEARGGGAAMLCMLECLPKGYMGGDFVEKIKGIPVS